MAITPVQWGALALSCVMSSAIYARRVLVLNRFRFPPLPIHVLAYTISLLAGVMWWVTLNSLHHAVWLQIVSGVSTSVLAWLVLVLLVNESLAFPTRQQWRSLVVYILTDSVFLAQLRLQM